MNNVAWAIVVLAGAILFGCGVGELVDRAELYAELRVPTPETRMASALASLSSRPSPDPA